MLIILYYNVSCLYWYSEMKVSLILKMMTGTRQWNHTVILGLNFIFQPFYLKLIDLALQLFIRLCKNNSRLLCLDLDLDIFSQM